MQPRVVLVTGATGAIGSALVPELLDDSQTQVVLLLRAETPNRLRERLEEMHSYWSLRDDAKSRVSAYSGDVIRDHIGVADADCEALAGKVTHIIHAAGNVALNQTIAEARADVVRGTEQVLALAQIWRTRGVLRKLDYFSTVGVMGRMPGVLPEQPVTTSRAFHNTYEQAKAEAESAVLSAMAQGLPATIWRPSMVVGDSRTGRCIRFQVFYHLAEFLSGRRSGGFVANERSFRLDLIPNDVVAKAVRLALDDQVALGRILHLCSGPDGSIPLLDVANAVRERFAAVGEKVPTLRPLPPWLFKTMIALARPFAGAKNRRALATLPLFLAYLAERQSFTRHESETYFSSRGLVLPRAQEYLPTVLDYYLRAKRQPQVRR